MAVSPVAYEAFGCIAGGSWWFAGLGMESEAIGRMGLGAAAQGGRRSSGTHRSTIEGVGASTGRGMGYVPMLSEADLAQDEPEPRAGSRPTWMGCVPWPAFVRAHMAGATSRSVLKRTATA